MEDQQIEFTEVAAAIQARFPGVLEWAIEKVRADRLLAAKDAEIAALRSGAGDGEKGT